MQTVLYGVTWGHAFGYIFSMGCVLQWDVLLVPTAVITVVHLSTEITYMLGIFHSEENLWRNKKTVIFHLNSLQKLHVGDLTIVRNIWRNKNSLLFISLYPLTGASNRRKAKNWSSRSCI